MNRSFLRRNAVEIAVMALGTWFGFWVMGVFAMTERPSGVESLMLVFLVVIWSAGAIFSVAISAPRAPHASLAPRLFLGFLAWLAAHVAAVLLIVPMTSALDGVAQAVTAALSGDASALLLSLPLMAGYVLPMLAVMDLVERIGAPKRPPDRP